MRLIKYAALILIVIVSPAFADSTQIKLIPKLKSILPNSVPDPNDCVSNNDVYVESKKRSGYTGTPSFGKWQQITCPKGYAPNGFRASVLVGLGHHSYKWSYYCCRLKGQYLS